MIQPMYMKVYNTLRRQIVEREYDVGAILPPEPSLEKIFGVSRTTIRKAVDMLVRDGMLSVRQGYGTQVISSKAVQSLNRITSFSEPMEKKGYPVNLRNCFIERVRASAEVANLLGIVPGTFLICVYRVKTAGDAPFLIARHYILEQMVPHFDLNAKIDHLYQYLQDNYNIHFTGCRNIVSARNASFEEAQVLEVEPRTALLYIRRVCYVDSRPVELDIVNVVAELYEYEVFVGERGV